MIPKSLIFTEIIALFMDIISIISADLWMLFLSYLYRIDLKKFYVLKNTWVVPKISRKVFMCMPILLESFLLKKNFAIKIDASSNAKNETAC